MSEQPKPTTGKRKSCDCDDPSVPHYPEDHLVTPTTVEWTEGHDGMGKWGIYHGNETRKGWSGKGRLLVDGLSESQSKSIADAHKAALAAELEKQLKDLETVSELRELDQKDIDKLRSQRKTLVDALRITGEALQCADYAMTHTSSDQEFALNSVRDAKCRADDALAKVKEGK